MRSVLAVLLVAACSSHPSGQSPDDVPDANGGNNDSGNPLDAPASSADDPANDGTSTYTTETVTIPGSATGRSVTATAYKPPSPHAVVVISPGFQMARTQYASYAKHLASWSFAVVLTDYADTSFFPDHTKMAADIKAVIDWAVANTGTDKVAVAGHSLGGKLSTFAASLDARVQAVIGWDPVDSNNPSVVPEKMSSVHAAVAVIGETTNGSGGVGGMACAPSADNFQQFYTAAASPAYQLTVSGADHMDWLDDPNCGFTCSACTAGTADPELSRKATRRLDVAWLRRVFLADTAMDVWLDSPPDAGLTVQRH